MRTTRTLLPALLAAALLLSGCGDDTTGSEEPEGSATPTASETATPTEEPTETPSEEPTPEEPPQEIITITVKGDSISPNGERVEAEVGEPLPLEITSDRAGELHVHSTPDQTVPFKAGTTETKVTVDQPGVVEVEEHETGFVVLQLQVR